MLTWWSQQGEDLSSTGLHRLFLANLQFHRLRCPGETILLQSTERCRVMPALPSDQSTSSYQPTDFQASSSLPSRLLPVWFVSLALDKIVSFYMLRQKINNLPNVKHFFLLCLILFCNPIFKGNQIIYFISNCKLNCFRYSSCNLVVLQLRNIVVTFTLCKDLYIKVYIAH